ncbi:3-oxo-5-alpha-steroid 4-dehydrogenase [Mycobacteroides abscessus]|uniref:3-oxo-5-alpha-steroid 4-dehydrogenase n=1 Tax=Mycobacteroides abscessus TaxID=36809 RepID=UPI0002683B35|nr:3-oxo-5-alpha-steroid 4-dehydrogenase [Mycobacteroides abscessus 4S-0303]EIT94738.1 3-oxo-5-alpha-steroid 4-dehydrogenase [Mycobacteroides abscessus 4S-0726-RA]SHS90442.1 steroid dehydrogenase [Mycobacteroides abscessus subsp. abscessus]SHU28522.1 3-oxo-5-alpha-steroid 4-dehydrogenase 2 [Mycobacteroides abscessus subsp. abscessus]SHV34416.1 3-oxo-5-alpha-steroid 4-dehydrogenase 2 [Mycobacteroides abscessus subsp. abscessus]
MAGLYDAAVLFLIVLTVLTLVSGIWFTNPYGRFASADQRFTLPATPGWLIFECPQWWAFTVTFWLVVPTHGTPALVLFGLWQCHYLYRGLIYPLIRRNEGKRFPISGVAFGFAFNAVNGFANGYAVAWGAHLQSAQWFTDPRFIVGIVVAVVGWVINFQADRILINLRADGYTGYRIPYGGAHRWVSSANYFGELVMWTGWAVMSWTIPGLIFVLFSIANLGPRAMATHKWYQQKFPDYPTNRKALIPGLL